MIGVAGAGAFGTALALALARKGADVLLWARDGDHVAAMAMARENARYLAGIKFPANLQLTNDLADLRESAALLLTMRMQSLAGFLTECPPEVAARPLIACCKGVDLASLRGPSAVITAAVQNAKVGVLTGPSFAEDIARDLPTALTLAYAGAQAPQIQALLSTPTLRLYLTDDLHGAELGGALKNVIAIAAGIVIGAGLGASARAAIMTRGFVEMQRMAQAIGARPETLVGLSGFGDLVLTCTSDQSRNFRYGMALGAGEAFDKKITVEGAATALAVAQLAQERGIDMPICQMIAALIGQRITLQQAVAALMSRPLKEE